MSLRLAIAGLSLITSCMYVSEMLNDIGVPSYIGGVPSVAIVAMAGLICILESVQSMRRSRRRSK